MNSPDARRRHPLEKELENVFHEHDRLFDDLQADQRQRGQPLLDSIDQWEKDAIRKIQKTAQTARVDAQRALDDTNRAMQRSLTETISKELRDTLQPAVTYTEVDIDRWMRNLADLRRQLDNMASSVEFAHPRVLRLIQVKQSGSGSQSSSHRDFLFETIHGRPVLDNLHARIRAQHSATLISRNEYSTGSHYFRFLVERTTSELFFGVVSTTHIDALKHNRQLATSIHGWWNIDRRVAAGRKEASVSTLRINNGDEVILVLNCDAREVFLEYPSMTKLNPIRMIGDVRECSPPWKILIEIGKQGGCSLRLIDSGVVAHGLARPERSSHCYCSRD